MAIFEDTDRIRKWRYVPKEINLIIPGSDPQSIPNERINTMTIINEYEKNLFPIFRIEIILEADTYYKIIKNKNTAQIHLRIDKYYQYSDSTTPSINFKSMNDTFDLLIDSSDEDLLKTSKQEASSKDYKNIITTQENDLTFTDNKIEMFLYKADVIKGLKNIVNQILKKCTMTDAVAYILNTAKVKNVLMSPLTNKKIYDDIIIPPLTCKQALQFVDTYYGLYKTGSLIYFGLDRNYILSYDGSCTAWTNDEIRNVVIIVPSRNSKHSAETGSIYKEGTKGYYYLIADYNTISIQNESISNDVINTSDVEYVDNYSGDVTATTSTATTKGTKTTKIVENKTENSWLTTMRSAQTDNKSVVITLNMQDINDAAIRPNKKFTIVFEDTSLTKKYQGTYQLCSATNVYAQDGADFFVQTQLMLRKTS